MNAILTTRSLFRGSASAPPWRPRISESPRRAACRAYDVANHGKIADVSHHRALLEEMISKGREMRSPDLNRRYSLRPPLRTRGGEPLKREQERHTT